MNIKKMSLPELLELIRDLTKEIELRLMQEG